MKIVLTGATGFLGFRTLEQLVLLNEIDSIIASGRNIKPSHYLEHPKVTYVLGELNDEHFVMNLLKNASHLIHTAALSSPWGKYEDFEQANIQSQENLIASVKLNGVRKFVFISTPSMYFDLTDKLNIKESDPLPSKLINAYSKTKRIAEIKLKESNIPFIILRPRALIGRGDTVIMPRIIRAYDEGRLKIIGNGENIADLTSVANVADAIILSLMAEGKAVNNTYNITNGEPVKLWDSISAILTKLDKEPPSKKVPFGFVKFIAQIMELKSRITNMKEPVLTKYGVGILAKSLTMDISKAKKILGYKPKVSTQEAIEEFVIWYKENEKS